MNDYIYDILVVVDAQIDFIIGSLGDKYAQAIVPAIENEVEKSNKNNRPVVFTKDTHGDDYLETSEGMISDSFADKDHPANKDSEYAQKYGKTEDEFNEWLEQKEKDWGIDAITYWEGDNGYFHFDRPDTGCVDEDMLSGFLQKENISLEEYLTNKKYVVIQDGDEYCYWGDIKNAGLIDMEAIDHEYPEYPED